MSKNSISRWFCVLYTIATSESDASEISQITKIPQPTVKRIIGQIRERYGVIIEFARYTVAELPDAKPRSGRYVIKDWGVFNSQRFLQKVKENLHEKNY